MKAHVNGLFAHVYHFMSSLACEYNNHGMSMLVSLSFLLDYGCTHCTDSTVGSCFLLNAARGSHAILKLIVMQASVECGKLKAGKYAQGYNVISNVVTCSNYLC